LLSQTGNVTTITGVQVTDADSNAATQTYTYSETSLYGTPATPGSSGSLQQIKDALGSITETAKDNAATETLTLTVSDGHGNSDSVSFVFAVGKNSGDGATLTGGAGRDVIIASSHPDTMTGKAGADQFVFAPTHSGNADIITDFTRSEDHIDLRAYSALVDSLTLNDHWISTHAALTANGQDTLITLDALGPGKKTDTILLQHVASTLHVGDFIVSPHTT